MCAWGESGPCRRRRRRASERNAPPHCPRRNLPAERRGGTDENPTLFAAAAARQTDMAYGNRTAPKHVGQFVFDGLSRRQVRPAIRNQHFARGRCFGSRTRGPRDADHASCKDSNRLRHVRFNRWQGFSSGKRSGMQFHVDFLLVGRPGQSQNNQPPCTCLRLRRGRPGVTRAIVCRNGPK